jgi:hypothetical protein
MKNGVKLIMSHVRDVKVVHSIDKRVFISVPLYFEKGMIFQSARIDCGELIIEGKMPTQSLSNTSHHPSASSEAFHHEML